MKTSLASFVAAGSCLFGAAAQASILPPNDLHLEDDPTEAANMTQEEFNSIIDGIVEAYQPIARIHGAVIKSNNAWSDSTVNASASRQGDRWLINMYGGLARRSEVTPDGFALVVCHELGHHLAGFPFRGSFLATWAANEGQSDYFATQACARKMWKADIAKNAEYREKVGGYERDRCDAAWTSEADRDLCYRVANAGLSLGSLLAALKKDGEPRFETPDEKKVASTFHGHPAAQCRLDTYLAGAACPVAFLDDIIPGRGQAGGQGSRAAEETAYRYSCSGASAFAVAARPSCWFAPKAF